jgi:hypothetical protein
MIRSASSRPSQPRGRFIAHSSCPARASVMAALAVANMGPWHSAGGMLISTLFAGVATGGVLAVWVHGVQNGRRRLTARPFAVSAQAIRLPSGVEVPASRIYALTLRNGLDDHVSIMVTNSSIGAAGSLGAAHAAPKWRVWLTGLISITTAGPAPWRAASPNPKQGLSRPKCCGRCRPCADRGRPKRQPAASSRRRGPAAHAGWGTRRAGRLRMPDRS